MIVLDFTLRDPVGSLAPSDLLNLDYADVAIELFQGEVIFIIDGIDLSLLRPIPLVDFAWTMFVGVCALGPDHKEVRFGAAEVPPRWTIRLSNSCVLISRDDISAVGKCGHAELIKATAKFGIRVYHALRDILPAAAESEFLSSRYPYQRTEAVHVIRLRVEAILCRDFGKAIGLDLNGKSWRLPSQFDFKTQNAGVAYDHLPTVARS